MATLINISWTILADSNNVNDVEREKVRYVRQIHFQALLRYVMLIPANENEKEVVLDKSCYY